MLKRAITVVYEDFEDEFLSISEGKKNDSKGNNFKNKHHE